MSIGSAVDSIPSLYSASINDSNFMHVHDYSDPLYLHPSDSSNTVFITCVLTGSENYVIWSKAMRFSLSGKNKLNFVE